LINCADLNNPYNALDISRNLALLIARLARMIMSQPEFTFSVYIASAERITRFARLRCTALPIDLPADTANLEISSSLGRTTNTMSG
jgi:hypothetical protein